MDTLRCLGLAALCFLGYGLVFLFGIALCKMGAEADKRVEEMFKKEED